MVSKNDNRYKDHIGTVPTVRETVSGTRVVRKGLRLRGTATPSPSERQGMGAVQGPRLVSSRDSSRNPSAPALLVLALGLAVAGPLPPPPLRLLPSARVELRRRRR